MVCRNFEELPAWQDSLALGAQAVALSTDPAFTRLDSLAQRMQQAALAVSNHISEAYGHDSGLERVAYLHHARGAAGELRSMTHLMEALPQFAHIQDQLASIRREAQRLDGELTRLCDGQTIDPTQAHTRGRFGSRFVDEVLRLEAKRREKFRAMR